MKTIITVMFAVLCATVSFAQTSSQPDTATLNFVTNAAKGGMTEVNTGKLAVQKGSSKEIKAFGAQMIKDHTKANKELMQIVAAKKWSVPAPSETETAPDAMLQSSNGKDFDISYVNMMVKDHKKTINLFTHAASASPDADIKAFATKTLPVLKHHYQMIQQIADKLNIAYEK